MWYLSIPAHMDAPSPHLPRKRQEKKDSTPVCTLQTWLYTSNNPKPHHTPPKLPLPNPAWSLEAQKTILYSCIGAPTPGAISWCTDSILLRWYFHFINLYFINFINCYIGSCPCTNISHETKSNSFSMNFFS